MIVSVVDVPRHEPASSRSRRRGARSSTPPGPVHVLLVVSALLALDAGDRLARRDAWAGRGRSRGSGALLGVFGSLLFSVALLPSFGAGSRGDRRALRGAGRRDGGGRPPARRDGRPGHHELPDLAGGDAADPGLALPDEPPPDVLDLAATFDARLLILLDASEQRLAGRPRPPASTATECFRELDLGLAGPAPGRRPLGDVRAFEVVCP